MEQKLTDYQRLFYPEMPIESRELLPGLLLLEQDYSFQGYGCDEYTEIIQGTIYVSLDLSNLSWKHINSKADWELLYSYFQRCSKSQVPTKIWIWRQIQNATPYEELSAKSQMKRDRYQHCYPRVDSKYFKDIPKQELELIIEDLQMDLGGNLNDWAIYRDEIPYHWVNTMQNRISELTKALRS
jgi:hypothetical protein